MNVQITSSKVVDGNVYAEATCENVSANVNITRSGVQVICQNSAHRVWRGAGRHFESVIRAIDGYKSGEMKAIIRAVAASVCEHQWTEQCGNCGCPNKRYQMRSPAGHIDPEDGCEVCTSCDEEWFPDVICELCGHRKELSSTISSGRREATP